MNLKNLYQLQSDYNELLEVQSDLRNDQLFSKKVLALHVQLGKLADASQCFKYWKQAEIAYKEVILNEYIDCLICLLTIGLDKSFQDTNVEGKHIEDCATDQFLNLYVDLNDFVTCSTKDNFITIFADLLSLGFSLSLTEDGILKSYEKKIKQNISRYKVSTPSICM